MEQTRIPDHPLKDPARRSRLGNWDFWLGLVISVISLVAAFWNVNILGLVQALGKANLLLVGLGLILMSLNHAVRAARWQVLMGKEGHLPAYQPTFHAFNIGIFLNSFTIARLGDLVRAFWLGETEKESKVFILSTIVVEKIADILWLLVLFAVLGTQLPLPEWLAGPARTTAIVSAVAVPVIILLAWQRQSVLKLMERFQRFIPRREWILRQTRMGLDGLAVLGNWKLLPGFLLWSLASLITGILKNYVIIRAMGIDLPIWSAVFMYVVLQASVAAPAAPGRVGVSHYLSKLSLTFFSVPQDAALACAVVIHLVSYLPIAGLGAYSFWKTRLDWHKLGDILRNLKQAVLPS